MIIAKRPRRYDYHCAAQGQIRWQHLSCCADSFGMMMPWLFHNPALQALQLTMEMGHALFTSMQRMLRQTWRANCKCSVWISHSFWKISKTGETMALARFETAGARFSRLWSGKVSESEPSQRSLHNAPIFRLLLKVAVKGTHQCDLSNFCGGSGPQQEMQWLWEAHLPLHLSL